MPKGGAGRHWKPTRSPGNDAPKCACGDGLTAIRSMAGAPLCRPHAGACKAALGRDATPEQVRAWIAQRQEATAPDLVAVAPGE